MLLNSEIDHTAVAVVTGLIFFREWLLIGLGLSGRSTATLAASAGAAVIFNTVLKFTPVFNISVFHSTKLKPKILLHPLLI